MLASYMSDPALFERCITLIDSIFPGIKKVALRGMQFQARWDRASIPFIAENKGEIIAHLGILPIDMMLEGNLHHAGALHGICVKKSYRGRGIFKKLMREAWITYRIILIVPSCLPTSRIYMDNTVSGYSTSMIF